MRWLSGKFVSFTSGFRDTSTRSVLSLGAFQIHGPEIGASEETANTSRYKRHHRDE